MRAGMTIGVIALACGSSWAQEGGFFERPARELWRPLSADRPDATESPHTVDPGVFQVELSFVEYSSVREDGERHRGLSVAPVLLKMGLTRSTDLHVGLEPLLHTENGQSQTGIGNLTLRLKHNLLGNDDGRVAIAVMPVVELPTGDDDLVSDEVSFGFVVPVGIDLGGGWGLGVQGEFSFFDEEGKREEAFTHTAVLGRELSERVGAFVEYIGEHDLDGDYSPYLSGGATYLLRRDLQLDAGFVVGLDGHEDVRVFAGVSFRF